MSADDEDLNDYSIYEFYDPWDALMDVDNMPEPEEIEDELGGDKYDALDDGSLPTREKFGKGGPVNGRHDVQRRTENAINRHRKYRRNIE